MPWVEKKAAAEAADDAEANEPVHELVTDPEAKVYTRATLLKVLECGAELFKRQITPATTAGARSSSERSSPRTGSDEPKEELRVPPTLAPAPAEASRPRRGAKFSNKADKYGASAMTDAMLEGVHVQAAMMAEWLLGVDPGSAPTTVMLRNIPNQYTRRMLQDKLKDKGFADTYDFLYLPIDRTSERNMGYAFINFRTQAWCGMFAEAFNGAAASKCLPGFRSNKVCEVRVADLQGFQANFEKMSTSHFLDQVLDREEWQPVFLDAGGKRIPLTPQKNGEGAKRRDGKKGAKKAGSAGWVQTEEAAVDMSIPFSALPFGSGMLPDADGSLDPWIMQQQQQELQEQWEMQQQAVLGFLGHDDQATKEIVMQKDVPLGGADADRNKLRAEASEFEPTKSTLTAEASEFVPSMSALAEVAAEQHVRASELAQRQAMAHSLAAAVMEDLAGEEDAKTAKVRKQIEYYFSVNNVCHDMYLRSLMDQFGWVRLDTLTEFPRLQNLGATLALVAKAVKNSQSLELSTDRNKARIRNAALRDAFSKVVGPAARPRLTSATIAAAAAAA